MASLPRAIVYIDGFNLYYGLLRGTPYRWLDLSAFARALLPAYDIVLVRYFTARLKPLPWDATGHYRQGAYLEALKSLPDVSVHLGEFRSNVVRRPLADSTRIPPDTVAVIDTKEKGSDVNLASHLLLDGFRNRYDAAVVVSNDSDLLEPVRMVREELGKRMHIVFTRRERRGSVFEGRVDDIMRHVNTSVLQRSQLPVTVQVQGRPVRKPREW